MTQLLLTGLGGTFNAASFAPSDLTNLSLWLRADYGITLNGSKVAQWDDKSGNGRNFANATGSSQPTYNSTGGSNNQPYIKFTRASETHLDLTNSYLSSLTGLTVFIVYYEPDPAGNQIPISSTGYASMKQRYNNNSYYYPIDNSAYGSYADTSTSWCYESIVFDGSQTGNANRLKMYLNNVQKTLTFAGTIGAALGSVTFTYMGGFYTGGSGFHFDGGISEYIVYNRALTPAEQAQVESYLATRYSL